MTYLESRTSRVTGIYLSGDRCRHGTGLNFVAPRLFRRIQQKLAAAKINGSRPFAHAKNSLLAKACDRLILESQLTPGLHTGLHSCALANIIVHCSRTRCCVRWKHLNVLDALSPPGFFKLVRPDLVWEPAHKRERKGTDR